MAKTLKQKVATYRSVLVIHLIATVVIFILSSGAIAITVHNINTIDGVLAENTRTISDFFNQTVSSFEDYVDALIDEDQAKRDDLLADINFLIPRLTNMHINISALDDEIIPLLDNTSAVEDEYNAIIEGGPLLLMDNLVVIDQTSTTIHISPNQNGHSFLLTAQAASNTILIPQITGFRIRIYAAKDMAGASNVIRGTSGSQIMSGFIRASTTDTFSFPGGGETTIKIPCTTSGTADFVDIQVLSGTRINVHGEVDQLTTGVAWQSTCP